MQKKTSICSWGPTIYLKMLQFKPIYIWIRQTGAEINLFKHETLPNRVLKYQETAIVVLTAVVNHLVLAIVSQELSWYKRKALVPMEIGMYTSLAPSVCSFFFFFFFPFSLVWKGKESGGQWRWICRWLGWVENYNVQITWILKMFSNYLWTMVTYASTRGPTCRLLGV